MHTYGRAAAALIAAATVLTASVAAAGESSKFVSTFDDIHYWIGEGTNRVVVIFDFHDGSKDRTSFAWGYRWNGEATNMTEIVDRITALDPRLHAFISPATYGSFVDAFGYDLDDDGGTFERVYNSETKATESVASDEDDIFPSPESYSEIDDEGHFVYMGTSWLQLWGTGKSLADVGWAMTPNGIDGTFPTNGQWVCWRFGDYSTTYEIVKDEDGETWEVIDEGYYFEPINATYAAIPGAARRVVLPSVGDVYYASLKAAFDAARGGREIALPSAATVDVVSRTITVGETSSGDSQSYRWPEWYDLVQNGLSVTFTLNAVATPTFTANPVSGMKPFSVDGDKVTVVPGNVIDGLYYGLLSATDLAKGFSEPQTWVRAENGSVVLEAVKTGDTGFYKVRVSDIAR